MKSQRVLILQMMLTNHVWFQSFFSSLMTEEASRKSRAFKMRLKIGHFFKRRERRIKNILTRKIGGNKGNKPKTQAFSGKVEPIHLAEEERAWGQSASVYLLEMTLANSYYLFFSVT